MIGNERKEERKKAIDKRETDRQGGSANKEKEKKRKKKKKRGRRRKRYVWACFVLLTHWKCH